MKPNRYSVKVYSDDGSVDETSFRYWHEVFRFYSFKIRDVLANRCDSFCSCIILFDDGIPVAVNSFHIW